MVLTRASRILLFGLVTLGLAGLSAGTAHADTATSSSEVNNSVTNVSITAPTTTDGSVITTSSLLSVINQSSDSISTDQTGAIPTSADPSGPAAKPVDSIMSSTDPTVGSGKTNSLGGVSQDPGSTAPVPEGTSPTSEGGASNIVQPKPLGLTRNSFRGYAPIVNSTNPEAPVSSSTPSGHVPPRPTRPGLPQGSFVLADAQSALVGQLRLDGASMPARDSGLTTNLFVAATLALFSIILLASLFLQFLKASGFARAPRGATPQLHFAFSVSEFDENLRFRSGSLFNLTGLVATARVD